MNIPLLIETLSYLRPSQIFHQLKVRLHQPKYRAVAVPAVLQFSQIVKPIDKPQCYNNSGSFTFLNLTSSFKGWNMNEYGALWAYNLNYMDWLQQKDITQEEGLKWIDKFIDDLPDNRVGLDPYPTALRIINWAKFFCQHPQCLDLRRRDSMYAQSILLSRKLEYHLLGNHLLEDAYAIFIASIFFNDNHLFGKANRLLASQLEEQILPDGAHYEQSPMYHCIMLDRLLDCVNFSDNNLLFDGQDTFTTLLREKASLMLGHLKSIVYQDGSIPLLNDAANGIAPTAQELFAYAERLHLHWAVQPLKECGYRKMGNDSMEIVADIGSIACSYQPGHSHADTFNYEMRIDGQPVIVDTGISTYNKNVRRQYERSTAAHNTVSVESRDSSRVWGGFRVGRRATVQIVKDTPSELVARHNGFGRHALHQRRFAFSSDELCIEDEIVGTGNDECVSYLHFSPRQHACFVSEADGLVKTGDIVIKIEGFARLELKRNQVATKYNKLEECDVLEMTFCHHLKYQIRTTFHTQM